MDILKLMASNNFIIVNRDLIKEFGTNGAVLLGELASEYNYYHDNNRLSDDGMFFSTIENVENNTGLSRYQQKKTIDELKKKGVIDVKLRGMPAKRYIRINTDKLFFSSQETSKQDSEKLTNKIVKNSLTSSQETNKQDSEKLANYMLKTNKQDSEKLTTNNNRYKNNNKTNNTYKEIEKEKANTSSAFIKDVIDHLNSKCNSHYKYTTPKTRQLIEARKKEGFTLDDFITVIDKKYDEWSNDSKMVIYLRPETLFGTKFESYLNQSAKKKISSVHFDTDYSGFEENW